MSAGTQIIHINLTSSHPIKIDPENHVIARFSYSVRWTPTDHPFKTRFERYLDHEFFEHKVGGSLQKQCWKTQTQQRVFCWRWFLGCRQIHWFSIFNSFMMVIFLVGLVTLILIRTLNRDLARYEHRDRHNELVPTRTLCLEVAPRSQRSRMACLPCAVPPRVQERELADDYGWKLVHGDVFRAPPQLGLFAALVGTGWQLTVLTVVVLLITIATDLYTEYAYLH